MESMQTLLLFGFCIFGLEALVGAGKDKCYSNIANFPCRIPKQTKVAKNVNKLTLGDIKVVIGLGDGFVSGTHILSRHFQSNELEKENPEANFLMGGDPKYITLPNLLLMYNKNLTGYSTKDDKGYNFAANRTITAKLKGQANLMFQKTKSHEKDWKLVNIFVGHVDFCVLACRKSFNASQLASNIVDVVRDIKAQMPNTFVNIVSPIDIVTSIFYYYKFKSENPMCQKIMPELCPCLHDDSVKITPNEMHKKENEFYQTLVNAIEEEDFDANNFAVVINALGASLNINFTLDFLAPDCFHPSLAAHQQFAIAMFNMLLANVHEKEPVLNLPTKLQCPEDMESPYLKTKKNSRSGQMGMKYESSFKFDPSKVKCIKH